jgi:hypothetical protein
MRAVLIALVTLSFMAPALAQKNEGMGVVAPPAQKMETAMPPPTLGSPGPTLGSSPPQAKPKPAPRTKSQPSNPK